MYGVFANVRPLDGRDVGWLCLKACVIQLAATERRSHPVFIIVVPLFQKQ